MASVRSYAQGGSAGRRWIAPGLLVVLSACGTTPLPPPPDVPPLFRRIEARVGAVYAEAARAAVLQDPLVRIEVGQASVARFRQAFAAMFAQVVELPESPSWRAAGTALDGVIELQRVDARMVPGNDASGLLARLVQAQDMARPDVVDITYSVCLYAPDGAVVRCWAASATDSHQRGPFDCLDMGPCIARQTEAVMRGAIARFMVDAENDPALASWAARIARRAPAP